jgi:homoserine O-acetyltransferase
MTHPTDARRYAPLSEPFPMWRGGALYGGRIAYETWGKLSARRDNAILLFTGPPRRRTPRPPRKTRAMAGGRDGGRAVRHRLRALLRHLRQFARLLLRLHRPASIDPATDQPYRLSFPDLSVEDIARAGYGPCAHSGSNGSTR